jgi:uncharacterized protein
MVSTEPPRDRVMQATIANRATEIATLCRHFGVLRLDIFGSATGLDFNPAMSDVDFLVEFQPQARAKAFDNFFGLREGLEDLFGTRIDLMTTAQVRNPYLAAEIKNSGRPIYGA